MTKMSSVLSAATVVLGAACTGSNTVTPEEMVSEALAETPLIDGHNDLVVHFIDCPECPRELDEYDISEDRQGRTDIPRWKRGRLGAQLLNAGWITTEPDADGTLKGFDLITRLVARHPELVMAQTADDVRRAHSDGKIAILLALENADRFQNAPALVRQYARLGLRSNILAYNRPSDLADGWSGPRVHGGLSDLGRRIVREMNGSGVLVDLSHSSAETMHDVLDVANAPVIFSHSAVDHFVELGRNVPDDVLMRLPDNGGIVMVTFVADYLTPAAHGWYQAYYDREEFLLDSLGDPFPQIPGWYWTQATANWYDRFRTHGTTVLDRSIAGSSDDLTPIEEMLMEWELEHPKPPVTVSDVADHIDYIKALIGPEFVGIGSDFDGDPSVVEGLEDVSRYPALLEELARRGWTVDELRLVAGENFLRVLSRADRSAAEARGGVGA